MKLGAAVLMLVALAAGLRADVFRFGPRVSGGFSKDVDYDAAQWTPAPVYSAGLQAEWDRNQALWGSFEVAYDQAAYGNSQAVAGPLYGGQTAHSWLTEDQVAESLMGGLRERCWDGRLHPRCYVGCQFTQALDLKVSASLAGQSFNRTEYFDQDHRYRTLGLLGLGLGLGRSDAVVLDLRLSQELWRQTGWSADHLFAKWQMGATWFYGFWNR
jgi:hypothetical protein